MSWRPDRSVWSLALMRPGQELPDLTAAIPIQSSLTANLVSRMGMPMPSLVETVEAPKVTTVSPIAIRERAIT